MGISIKSWVWPGNTQDMSVIEEVKDDLVGWKLGRVITVCDCGFGSDDNLRYLQRAGGHYIVGEKLRSKKKEVKEAMARPDRHKDITEDLKIKEIISEIEVRPKLDKDQIRHCRYQEKLFFSRKVILIFIRYQGWGSPPAIFE